REIRHRAEAAEALAQDAPPLHAELAPNPLGVAHDRVCAEMLQVIRLLPRAEAGHRADRARAARAALVEHQHAKVAPRAVQPSGPARMPGGPGRLVAGATLEKHQERPVAPVRIADLARKDRDARSLFMG